MSIIAGGYLTALLDKRGIKKIEYLDTSINPPNEVIPS